MATDMATDTVILRICLTFILKVKHFSVAKPESACQKRIFCVNVCFRAYLRHASLHAWGFIEHGAAEDAQERWISAPYTSVERKSVERTCRPSSAHVSQ